MAVKVKVCGITSLGDAEKSLEFGADMLGFNFYPLSPRALTAQKARAIIEQLPQTSFNVAVLVNEPREKVLALIAGERHAFRGLQFHGEESAAYCQGWGMTVIKAIRLKEKSSLTAMKNYSPDFFLLDSWSTGYGGSGAGFPWEWIEGVDGSKLILSGGLGVENVADAIKRVRPYGVDVCSSVEARPGVKDYGKLKEFIAAAKAA